MLRILRPFRSEVVEPCLVQLPSKSEKAGADPLGHAGKIRRWRTGENGASETIFENVQSRRVQIWRQVRRSNADHDLLLRTRGELKACEHLKKCLQSEPGDADWVLRGGVTVVEPGVRGDGNENGKCENDASR